ncbi:MAG: prenyltransferase [Acidimicrobiia bacterium]
MATLAPIEAVARARGYGHAVLSFVAVDGYPSSVAADLAAAPDSATVELGPLAGDVLPDGGQQVCVTVSHIRPQPGVGYDERRYVNLWGTATIAGDRVRVDVTRAGGWDEQDVPFLEYAERNVPAAHEYFDEVGARPRLSTWWKVFLATRLPFLTATIVPIALAGAVAARDDRFSWGWWLLALLAGCAVHLGLNIANDLFDDASGADAANMNPTPFSGGSRVIQYGLVSRRQMLVACVVLYSVAVGLGFFLAATRGWWLLAIGATGVVLSVVYSAPPLRLVHRGLGEPVTALGFGPVMTIGAYWVVAERWSWEAIYVSLPIALLVALVLYVNEIPDRGGDAAAGKRTLPVRWPSSRVIAAYVVTAATAFGLVLVGGLFGPLPLWALLGLLAAPLAVRVARGLRAHYDSPYELIPAMQTNIGLHLFTGLLLLAGYLVDLAVR